MKFLDILIIIIFMSGVVSLFYWMYVGGKKMYELVNKKLSLKHEMANIDVSNPIVSTM